jgi:hypothetical protein
MVERVHRISHLSLGEDNSHYYQLVLWKEHRDFVCLSLGEDSCHDHGKI